MMQPFVAGAAALWLGILTSISPCPVATNIVAISFIGKQISNPKRLFASGIAYTAGRAAAYLVLGALLVASVLSAPQLSHGLQKFMTKLTGPLVVFIGMVLLDMVPLPSFGARLNTQWQQRVASAGMAGAASLGFVFALSFCPVSAALFFGSLVPLAVKHASPLMLPALYGVGTGLPVVLCSVLIALGARSIGVWFNRLTSFEYGARRLSGIVFILIGCYLTLLHVFGWTR